MPSSRHITADPVPKSTPPTLWIECLPSDLQIRIAQYVSGRISGLDALNLAKASPLQRHAVSAALRHDLRGCFARHEDGLVNDWVEVFQDVRVLELHEHPPNFHLLSSPSLRVLVIEDEPLQLEALAKSDVELDRLALHVRYKTPAYLVCRLLAKVWFRTFVLFDHEEWFLQHLDTSELLAACEGVDTLIFEDHRWIQTGVADFVTSLPYLRELVIDIQGTGSLLEFLPTLKRLQYVRITAWDTQLRELIGLTKQTGVYLKALCLMSFESCGDGHILALSEAVNELCELEKLTITLSYGTERYFPRLSSLMYLEIHWRGELEIPKANEPLYKPNDGDIVKMIERLPALTALRLWDVGLSQTDVISIFNRLGRLKEFGMTIDAEGDAPHRMVLTIMETVTTYVNELDELELRENGLTCLRGTGTSTEVTWNVKQDMLRRLDRLQRHSPDLDIQDLEDIIVAWPCKVEGENDEEIKAKKEAYRNIVALRRCRRGMNEDGGVLHLMEFAGLLETGCEGLEQDVDAAIEIFKRVVRRGERDDAIMKLWDLTETDGHESSEVKTGGALELMLEMSRKGLKTLPEFAELFREGTRRTPSNHDAAERILQLAVDDGQITE